ncbi:hypothetical protein [Variovorax fucosicus]|uniref:hypothetical protein n=1 Tax=Variovorax fucosicus TaxID=3053517 RepID=UPI0025785B5E|nr:hypothetical protein [Variovorax sp. J22G47]MDM0059038.1 hypothetical protein [Variovorax sp. J22G47]
MAFPQLLGRQFLAKVDLAIADERNRMIGETGGQLFVAGAPALARDKARGAFTRVLSPCGSPSP